MGNKGWLSNFYDNSGYVIENGSIKFIKTDLETNQYEATAKVIENSYGYDKQSGGSVRKYKITSQNHADAFKQLQFRIENGKSFYKNKLYLVSVSDLDTKNKLYRVYKK
jgi:hypothetical protein